MKILVTGASSGIGEVLCRTLRASGYDIVGWDVNAVAPWIDEVDVTDRTSVERALDRVGELGAVVHCAGIGSRGRFVDTPGQELRTVFEVNLWGAAALAHAVHSRLPVGGSLVLFGSVAGSVPIAERAAYCASKAGVRMLAKVLAHEWSEDGINVYCVSPGFVEVGMASRGIEEGESDPARILERTPGGSMVRVEDVVEVVRLAISGGLPGIVGGELVVDNGFAVGTRL